MNKRYSLLFLFTVFLAICSYGQAPVIGSFAPASGVIGTTVTITGTGFNATPAQNVVFFGAVKAAITSGTTSQLVVTVPAGATYQPVSVINLTTKLTGFSVSPFITTFTTKNSISASDIDLNMDFPAGSNPFSVAIADIDGDNKPDVVVTNTTSNTFSVLLNKASGNSITPGSFGGHKDVATLANPTALAIGDINSDGKPDVVVVYQLSNTVSVFTNTTAAVGTPTFQRADFAGGSASNSIAIGDINRDGKPDIVVANYMANTVSVLTNVTTTGASFAARVDLATGTAPNDVCLADIDNDGKLDILTANLTANTISVIKNTTTTATVNTTTFLAKQDFLVAGAPTSMAVGDITGDGLPDVVISDYTPAKKEVTVLANNGIQNAITPSSFKAAYTQGTGAGPLDVKLGDIDGDGRMDVVAADMDNQTVSVLRNTSTGSGSTALLASKLDLAVGTASYSIAVGDLDGDGKPDIVTANNFDNTVSVLHNYNPASVPGPGFAESTASVSLGSFINTDILDAEYTQDPPVVKSADGSTSYTYTAASVSGSTITGTTTNAGRFVYFASGGTVNPLVKINGALTFSAMGSGTIDVQIIATNNMKVQFSRTFTLNSSAFQDYGWYIKDLYPQTEYIIAVMFNGGNSSVNASAQFKKNLCLTLQQAGMSGEFTRYRADVSSLIGNVETGWYGWDYNTNTAKKKYIQHSAYARMRFQTDANKIAIEYVRDFYDRRVLNLFPLTTVQNGKDFDAAGNVVAGVNVINNAIKVTGGKTYTISGLQTHSPTYVFYNNGVPLAAPAALTPVAGSNPLAYTVTAPATANTLGLLVQRIVNTADYSDPANDTYFVYSNCMVQEGAYGTMTQYDGAIPTPFIAYAGDLPSHISGPAVFINGSLYKYYQVEGNDVAKQLQFISDDLPPGTKTVEVMMPGQGTYSDNNNVLTDPHIRRGGTFLRAVYFPSSNTTVVPATTVKAGSVLFIHDSILSGFNISSDAQNNVWMMKLIHDPTLAFTGDVYSEGYAGRILHTDTRNDANNNSQIPAFAQKLAAYNVNKYWFQIGVNDYGFMTPLHQFYSEYKSLVEQLNAIRAGAKMYIQGIGPDAFEGPNAETYADNGLATTGPTANDFRDVQRAIATTHSYCEYVNFEGLFAPTGANLADGIHPTDAGNQLYANGVKSKSTLLGTTVAAAPLAFYRNTLRSFVQNVPTVSVVTATGGKTPYVFSLVSGTLPAGLQFNPDGVITGTPTQSGTVTLTVNVADANNTNVAQNFSFTVNPVPGVVVVPLHLQNAQVGVLYKKQLYGALGYGKYTLTHTGTLPPGITLNDNTGILTGTPTASRVAPYTFSVKAVDHWGFFGTTNYSLTVGTTTPAMLSDNFTVTAAVSPSNHLLLTGHLNDIYTTTLYTFIEAYFTPAGGSEIFLGGKNVNIDAGLKDGVTVDMGAMGLLPGNFSVRTHNDGIAPSIINATNISYDLDVSSNLSTSTTSPVEQLTATISVNAAGQLLVTTHLPNTHTQPIYAFIVPYITQNGNTVYIDGQNVVIPANAKDSPAVNFGTLNVNTGAYSVRLSNLGTNPTSTDGVVINFSASTNFSLVK